jgi:putative peptidoglycan lipid II flippase
MLLPLFLQGNIVIERAVASLLGVNAAASLDYAKFITDTGVLLFAVPLGLASLSVISRMTDTECHALVARILPGLLLFTVPISTAVAVHSHIIIELIYQRGAFGTASTQLTQTILRGFALGFWAQVVSYVLLKTLSARLRNTEVFRLMALALAANALINIGLYRFLGPIVLGLGSCAYALVLMLGAARALNVLSDIVNRLTRLAGGAVLYAILASILPQEGIQAMAASVLLFCVYWPVFITASPLMRGDARRWISVVWRRTRTRPSV